MAYPGEGAPLRKPLIGEGERRDPQLTYADIFILIHFRGASEDLRSPGPSQT